MTATQIPTRMIVLLGVALAALAAMFVARPLLLGDSDAETPPAAVPAQTTPSPAKPAVTNTVKPTQPKVVLLPGLPKPIARRLQHSRVVVVSVYAGSDAGDRVAVAEARRGARISGAGFASMNVLNESIARQVQPFIGTTSPPVLLVVRRPGKIVTRFDGIVDEAIVAQAATNAGARSGKK